MIVAQEELKRHRGAVTMVDGAFDPLHHGRRVFPQGGRAGVPRLLRRHRRPLVSTKHPPLLADRHRLEVIDAMRSIFYTYLNSGTTESVLRELRPRYYVNGKDRRPSETR
jgi:hypothetical protein